MQRRGKLSKSEVAWAVVFLIYVASSIWFYYTNQPSAAIIYVFTSFLILRRVFNF